jgi:hypothetical protein
VILLRFVFSPVADDVVQVKLQALSGSALLFQAGLVVQSVGRLGG